MSRSIESRGIIVPQQPREYVLPLAQNVTFAVKVAGGTRWPLVVGYCGQFLSRTCTKSYTMTSAVTCSLSLTRGVICCCDTFSDIAASSLGSSFINVTCISVAGEAVCLAVRTEIQALPTSGVVDSFKIGCWAIRNTKAPEFRGDWIEILIKIQARVTRYASVSRGAGLRSSHLRRTHGAPSEAVAAARSVTIWYDYQHKHPICDEIHICMFSFGKLILIKINSNRCLYIRNNLNFTSLL